MSMLFVNFAEQHGVAIDPSKLYPGERIRRCPTVEKPRSTNGAYFWDGERGWVFAWDGEARVQWFQDPNARPWTEQEKQEWAAKRRHAAQEIERRNQEAAHNAAMLIRGTTPQQHDYLIRKGFPDVDGLVTRSGDLVVPMRSFATNELQGAQVIRWIGDEMRWDKKMLPGMKARGAVLRLGPKTAFETIFCEGYATGLSIAAAVRQLRLNAAVLVCFSDSNLTHVAGLVQTSRRWVFADNDPSEAGERAAIATGLPYVMSDRAGEDANDIHKRAGLMPLCHLVMKARTQEVEMA